MAEYSWLIDDIETLSTYTKDGYTRAVLNQAVKAIRKLSDDVVPVVRCKECQNSYEWANVDGDNYRYCGYLRDRWNHDYDRMVDDDDFCKWGRKMDGGRP